MNETGNHPPGSSRTWIYVVLGCVLAWTFILYAFGPRRGPGALGGPELAGNPSALPADYNWTLEGLDAQPVDFARYKGRVVFLNIWATWCPPCVAEMPSIANLAANPKLQAKNVAFVCASTDDDLDTVRRFVAGKDWPMTILRATSLPPAFATDGIPATFIIAPDGRVVTSHVGSARWDEPDVVDFLERLGGG